MGKRLQLEKDIFRGIENGWRCDGKYSGSHGGACDRDCSHSKKVSPAYGMLAGAFIGGLVGGVDIVQTVNVMMEGAKDMIPAVLRIMAAGVLAGVLIESGAALSIAEAIVRRLGEARALLALALATMILTTVGVFVDVAVITVAPIALAIAKRAKLSKTGILLAMIGGGRQEISCPRIRMLLPLQTLLVYL